MQRTDVKICPDLDPKQLGEKEECLGSPQLVQASLSDAAPREDVMELKM